MREKRPGWAHKLVFFGDKNSRKSACLPRLYLPLSSKRCPEGHCKRGLHGREAESPAPSAMSPAHTTAAARERARALDREDPLAFTRNEFNIPTKAQIASTRLPDPGATPHTPPSLALRLRGEKHRG